ncbi:MAG: redoxin family protein [Chloroherpetonaceae bacterium]|nr:redoxin family protein [Chthonomonadaceae bacterium]MDW8208374.1 redoxin family protein [Chloroherpetonaceae bacterium]
MPRSLQILARHLTLGTMITGAALGALCVAGFTDTGVRPRTAAREINVPVRPLRFRDLGGRAYTLGAGNGPAVYLFLATECPVANGYTPRILALEKAYRERGVRFFAVYPNAHEPVSVVARHARERGYTFPVVKDNGTLARALGATMTPEAVLVDRQGMVRYRGRIDDNRDPAKVRQRDLQEALSAVLEGRRVARPTAPAYGCAILFDTKPAKTQEARVTYARDVAPILQQNCLVCHRQGEVAPFALETYAQARVWARQIKIYTQNRRMPPWRANSNGEFHNERRLTDQQIATLAAWVDAGAPPGDLKQTPPPPKFPSGWQLGEPDVVLEMPETYEVPAEGRDVYRCFVIPTGFTEDRWVTGVEVRPGNRAVVHHVIGYLDRSGRARQLDAADPGPGYNNPTPGNVPGFVPVGMLAGWAPGNAPQVMPPGVGMLVPRGADLVLEVHYHMNGKPEKDRTKIGLHFAKGPIEKAMHTMAVLTTSIRIPPGEANHVIRTNNIVYLPDAINPMFRMGLSLGQDITVLSVMPHMHLIGRSMKVRAILPDGSERLLVDVPDWDFNWQMTYVFKQPVRLPRGTRLEVEARYDNSSSNPFNPNTPPKEVRYGEQSTDEMCVAFLNYTQDSQRLNTNSGAAATASR